MGQPLTGARTQQTGMGQSLKGMGRPLTGAGQWRTGMRQWLTDTRLSLTGIGTALTQTAKPKPADAFLVRNVFKRTAFMARGMVGIKKMKPFPNKKML